MNIIETGTVMDLIQTAYPAWKAPKQATVLWAQCFVNDPVNVVLTAVKTFIARDTKGFAPAIGQIRAIISQIAPKEEEMTELEAWARIRKAISNGLYGAYKEFAALPPILQKVVGDPEQLTAWAMLTEGLDTVVASNVMRTYRMLLERERTRATALPIGQLDGFFGELEAPEEEDQE